MIAKFPLVRRHAGRAILFAGIFSAASAWATPQVATPNFNPASGVYSSAQSVEITTATSGASIAYTTDGSIPAVSGGTITHGTLYSGVLTVSNTTLSAIAFANGYSDSAVAISGYTVQAADSTVLRPDAGNPSMIAMSSAVPTMNSLYSWLGTVPNPYGSLIQGSDGNLYGTTSAGGSSNNGTVFKITLTGTYTTLVSFIGTNGATPYAGLIQAGDGNFYGTTSAGGSSNNGTIFKMTSTGTLTTLASFTGTNGATPFAGLVQSSDGNFYGTTSAGGGANDGTVFKITSTGTLTTLVSFTGSNGMTPYAGLIQASDGNFYGTTESGGSANNGTVFKITPTGTLTSLVSFTGTNGATPLAGLVQGSDGNFYGATKLGGSNNDGTILKMTPSGVLTTLVTFNGTNNGANPTGTLIQGSDGNFYGTTQSGGSNGAGTVLKMTSTGVLTTLVSLFLIDGADPVAGVVQGNDGNFYGTCPQGGGALNLFFGFIFQVVIPPTSAAPTFSPAAGTYASAQTVTITSATSGASIRYTTDGSTPTETNGTLYSGPVSITTTTTLQAIAYKTGFVDSSISSGTYTINIPTPAPPASGGGGAPSYWFLGFLAFAGLLRWKLRKIQALA